MVLLTWDNKNIYLVADKHRQPMLCLLLMVATLLQAVPSTPKKHSLLLMLYSGRPGGDQGICITPSPSMASAMLFTVVSTLEEVEGLRCYLLLLLP